MQPREAANALITVITPVFNEEGNIRPFYDAISKVLSGLNWELIYVNDGSIDRSKELVLDLAQEDERIRLVSLSKNYGHQIALTAGFDHAAGDIIITMDGDLQHPPETIAAMLEKWEGGSDIVFAQRTNVGSAGWFKAKSSKLFYRTLRWISNVDLVENSSDFRLLDRAVADHLKQYRESSRFIRGIVSDLGFKRSIIEYEEKGRVSGTTKYSLKNMVLLGMSGILSFSSFPLRISTILGMLISFVSVLYALWITYYKLVYDIPAGQASILVGIFFIGGIQLISIGILGEYLALVFIETKKRPLYCVEQVEHPSPAKDGQESRKD